MLDPVGQGYVSGYLATTKSVFVLEIPNRPIQVTIINICPLSTFYQISKVFKYERLNENVFKILFQINYPDTQFVGIIN